MTDCSLLHLVIAVTLASVLSHISLLVLLGRRDELNRGVNMLTESFSGLALQPEPVACGRGPAAPPVPCDRWSGRMPYRMYDDSMPAVPAATPAGDPGFGAPIGWSMRNPAPAPPVPHDRARLTQNYFL